MSIKDLFDNKGVPKIQKTVTSDELVAPIESEDFVEAKISSISTSPERDDTILVEDPFQN